MTRRVFDFAGDQSLLAGGAISHATAEIEIQIDCFSGFKQTFFIIRPLENDIGFLEGYFRHSRFCYYTTVTDQYDRYILTDSFILKCSLKIRFDDSD